MSRKISPKFSPNCTSVPITTMPVPTDRPVSSGSPGVGLCSGPRQMGIALKTWWGGIEIVEMETNVQFQH
jgi:hypothetical protein